MRIERAIVLPAAPERVWAVVTDWEGQAGWMLDADRVEVVSAHREGVGVKIEVKTRIAGIPAFVEPMEVTGWDRPRQLDIRHGSLVSGDGRWVLEPVAGGTRFTWTEDIRLRVPVIGGTAAYLYRPVMKMLMGRAMQGLRSYVIAIGPAREG